MAHTERQQIWSIVHEERRRLAADLSGIAPDSWGSPSLCPGWDVHDVLAHLLDSAKTTRRSFVRDLVRARFDFDRANQVGVERERRGSPEETLRAWTAAIPLTCTPPADRATRLVEAIVHGEDIRRPLGLAAAYPAWAVRAALDYQVRTPAAFGGGRERARGRRLVDSESGASWGTGDPLEGAALDLLMHVSGRPVAPPDRRQV